MSQKSCKPLSDLPDIVVSVGEEFTQNIDGHYSQSAIGLYLQHGENRLIQD
jgi:hypothetical protein